MCVSDGTAAQVIYRAMQYCHLNGHPIAAALLNGLNFHLGHAVIGRGADIGPGFVILHSSGVCINSRVHAGENLVIEHNVTIGAEQDQVPVLGDNVFIGAGSTIVGGVRIGSNVKIAANSLVMKDLPDGATAVGVPAQVVRVDRGRVGPQAAKDNPSN
jgi:serine O-acetyltransferase